MTKKLTDVAKVTTRPAVPQAGLPCPKCGTRIDISLDALLVRRRFTCANVTCRTTLTLDEGASAEALKVARMMRAEVGTQNVRARRAKPPSR